MMNKVTFVFTVIFAMLSFSCQSDDPLDNTRLDELIEKVDGLYKLQAAVSNIALDYDGDGVANIDLFQEAYECSNSLVFTSYYCLLRHRENYDEIDVEVPLSEHRPHLMPNSCLRDKTLAMPYDYDIDENNIFLVSSSHWEEYNASFKSKILNVDWQNQWVYVTVETEHYDALGNWTTVVLYLSYKKFSNRS
jgi:hypothetical protein